MKQITLDFETYEYELCEKFIDGNESGQTVACQILLAYYHDVEISFDKYSPNQSKEFKKVLQLIQLLKMNERGTINHEN